MKLDINFFNDDVLNVAPKLIGKLLVRNFGNGIIKKYRITEVEAYRGEEDLACHACKGKTPRNEVMYMKSGTIYIYLIYGMYNMLNIVTEKEDVPQAILIRGIEGFNGPGKLTKALQIDKILNKQNIFTNDTLSIESDDYVPKIKKDKRIGIDYAGEIWKNKLWRFIDEQKNGR